MSACGGGGPQGNSGPPPPPPARAEVAIGDSIVASLTLDAINLGRSGDTTGMILTRIHQVPNTAQIIVIEGGINDMLNALDAQIVPNYTAILDALPPSAQVVMVGILPVEEHLLPGGWIAFVNNAKIDAMNTQLWNLCASKSNCTPMGLAPFDTTDGIHPTAAARVILSDAFNLLLH